ncbi:hypothetical protein C9374_005687 [Naegleria lovaniensis]|uniref:Teneurin NHL domain-containing protein n=1 Tax=Naegleria lovaniensis TaxID=51637 RepID=A0AA88GKJ8_NAELO|nr:uncharacterized protein C9374_005687 [Naegleria lovaniensis]KAG2381895.1 hypothetical protein C9374_005687 [Naegleria lovaniensis]
MFPSNPHWHVRQQDSLSYTSIFLLILSILSFNQQQYVIHVVRAQSSPYSFPVRYVIATVAGTGNSTFNGEGLNSFLCNMKPRDVVRPCEACSIYVADNENHRILKIQHGVVTTVAGSGLSSPFNGHDLLATSANLNSPQGIFVSSNEEFLWIAETEGHRIRRVHLNSGNMTTVAGTGTPGNGGDGGLAVNAQLNFPTKVMVDSNSNLYIADGNNHKIRKVDTNGYISSFAGTGSPGNSGDGGPAQNAQLDFPSSLFQDEFAGDIFIVDTNNHAIRKVSKSGQMSTIVSGAAGLNYPSSVHYFPYEQQLSITDQ